jgi:hypothetical protein
VSFRVSEKHIQVERRQIKFYGTTVALEGLHFQIGPTSIPPLERLVRKRGDGENTNIGWRRHHFKGDPVGEAARAVIHELGVVNRSRCGGARQGVKRLCTHVVLPLIQPLLRHQHVALAGLH